MRIKIPKLLTRIMALLMALFMVGSMLMSALPLSAANSEISLRRVGGYPRITFYDEEGNAIPELTDLDVSDDSLSFDSETVSYKNKDKEINIKEQDYSRFDILLAYADYNYPLNEEQRQFIKENGASEFVQNSAAMLKLGDEDVEATQIDFGVSTSGYLIAKMLFAGVNFLDDENNELNLYLQYLSKNEDGSTHMAKGNTQYKLSRVETTKKDNAENPDGDVNFGDGEQGEIVLPEDEIAIKSSTPYIIVEEYSFAGGSTQVAAGSSFNLNLICRNTHSSIDLENIIMKVSTSAGLQITNSSNTFYISKLGDKECFEKDLTISALSNAEAQSHSVTVSFNYEYVADDARQQGEMTQDISIPVVQKDRFSADPVDNVSDVIVGDEIDVISKYMNKSRGQLFNLTAELLCEDPSVSCEEKIQHVGNLQAGASGEMEFSISGEMPGTFSCEILYTYEDALGNVKETRVPFEVTFVEAPTYEWDQPTWDEPVMDDVIYDEFGNPIDPFAEEQGLTQNQMLLIGGGAAAAIILAAVIIKKRKAKKEFEDEDENF